MSNIFLNRSFSKIKNVQVSELYKWIMKYDLDLAIVRNKIGSAGRWPSPLNFPQSQNSRPPWFDWFLDAKICRISTIASVVVEQEAFFFKIFNLLVWRFYGIVLPTFLLNHFGSFSSPHEHFVKTRNLFAHLFHTLIQSSSVPLRITHTHPHTHIQEHSQRLMW